MIAQWGAGMTTLRDALSAPFVFRTQTVPGPSSYVRTAAYPELGCEVSGETMPELLEALEIARVHLIVDTLAAGRPIAPLRPPIPHPELEALLARAGLAEWIERLDEPLPLDHSRLSAAAAPGPGAQS